MPTKFELNKAYNENLLDEIQFTLQDRKEPTIVMMSVEDYDLQKRLLERLKEKLPKCQFYDIDLTPFQVESLHQTLQKELPQHILDSERITYCINVFGLENSRLTSENGQIINSGLISQLNFEREVIFRKPNYITILWADHDFFLQIQRQAPDLWSWITNFFVFKQDEEYHQNAISPEPSPTPAKLPVREEYIKSLTDKLNHLPLNDPDKGRVMREKLNLYSLLADEYAKYFDYNNAKKYYENAIGLSEKLKVKEDSYNKLLFNYGTLNLIFLYFEESIEIYSQLLSKVNSEKNKENIGSIFHQIGRVYQELRMYDKAIINYQNAISWKKKLRYFEDLGGSYNQIGMIYHEQNEFDKALKYYQMALDANKNTKQDEEIGTNYYQIGLLFQHERKDNQALENYQNAANWYEQTFQKHHLGRVFHQVGIIYHLHKMFDKALENFQKAISLKKQTGQINELGGTYHQIGILFEEQKEYDKALQNYQEAIFYKERVDEGRLGSTYYHIGSVYESLKQYDLAIKNYEKALSLYPKHSEYEIKILENTIERIKEIMQNTL